jgi:hypothetical protein
VHRLRPFNNLVHVPVRMPNLVRVAQRFFGHGTASHA